MQVLEGHISTSFNDTRDYSGLVNNFLLPVIYCSIIIQFIVFFSFVFFVLQRHFSIFFVQYLDVTAGIEPAT